MYLAREREVVTLYVQMATKPYPYTSFDTTGTHVWKGAGMGLRIVTFTFILSLPCLHTFWCAIPTSFLMFLYSCHIHTLAMWHTCYPEIHNSFLTTLEFKAKLYLKRKKLQSKDKIKGGWTWGEDNSCRLLLVHTHKHALSHVCVHLSISSHFVLWRIHRLISATG